MSEFWNERFGVEGYAYGLDPNGFLASHAERLPAGRVLCLAEGEGRNATFLATRGHRVTAVDQSSVGLAKARDLAAKKGVEIETFEADLGEFEIESGAFDGVVSIFAHVPPAIRLPLHRQVVEKLKPSGVFLLEAYTPKQLEMAGVGGPSAHQRDLLMTLDALEQELVGLDLVVAQETERDIREGQYHQGLSAVVQIVGVKR